jgi:NADH-quinone oxidoreductase subunit M
MAFTVTNARLILGYSSLAQLGFIVLGIFALDTRGADGALLQMVTHALVTVALILIVALLARRADGSEDIRDMGGLAFRAPAFAAVFLVLTLALLAMPGSANFVGEFMILLGVFETKMALAIIASIGVAMAAVYALRLYITTMLNRQGSQTDSKEMTAREALVIVPVMLVLIALSLVPQFALRPAQDGTRESLAAAREVIANDGSVADSRVEARR